MKIYKVKLYKSKRNKKLHLQINIAGLIYNHCIAMHRRYYRLFKKSLTTFTLSKHLAKLKKLPKYAHWKLVGSQAIQDISERIDRANRQLSRKQKDNNRRKMKAVLVRLYRETANQWNDFHWKLANKLCGEYAIIYLEDLNLKGMQKLYGRKISDPGFADFVSKLEYTATKTGTTIVKVGRFFPSSQRCLCCGQQNHQLKDLRIRTWQCSCGAVHQRDRNAAVNIINEGMKAL